MVRAHEEILAGDMRQVVKGWPMGLHILRQPVVIPPTLLGVENPSSATIVCQGDTFTFKLNQALADNGGIYLVIEASEGQSNGVSRAHAKASAIKMVEEPTAAAVDIRADYVAKNGSPSAAASKIFFRYYLVDSSTGVSPRLCWRRPSGKLLLPLAVSRSLRPCKVSNLNRPALTEIFCRG